MFSSHLMPWKPVTERMICSSWKRMKNSTMLLKPKSVSLTMFSAAAPIQLWKPYQSSAGRARTRPGTLVPANPKALRAWTMKGMP